MTKLYMIAALMLCSQISRPMNPNGNQENPWAITNQNVAEVPWALVPFDANQNVVEVPWALVPFESFEQDDDDRSSVTSTPPKKGEVIEIDDEEDDDNQPLFSCTQEGCNKEFKTSRALMLHLPMHPAYLEKMRSLRSYQCSVCSDRFAHKADLTAHESSHRLQQRRLFGAEFFRGLPSNCNVRRLPDADAKKYTCAYCSQQYTRSWTRNRHEKTCSVRSNNNNNNQPS